MQIYKNWTAFWHNQFKQYHIQIMGTLFLLIGSALLCFAIFYKAIEWFERI